MAKSATSESGPGRDLPHVRSSAKRSPVASDTSAAPVLPHERFCQTDLPPASTSGYAPAMSPEYSQLLWCNYVQWLTALQQQLLQAQLYQHQQHQQQHQHHQYQQHQQQHQQQFQQQQHHHHHQQHPQSQYPHSQPYLQSKQQSPLSQPPQHSQQQPSQQNRQPQPTPPTHPAMFAQFPSASNFTLGQPHAPGSTSTTPSFAPHLPPHAPLFMQQQMQQQHAAAVAAAARGYTYRPGSQRTPDSGGGPHDHDQDRGRSRSRSRSRSRGRERERHLDQVAADDAAMDTTDTNPPLDHSRDRGRARTRARAQLTTSADAEVSRPDDARPTLAPGTAQRAHSRQQLPSFPATTPHTAGPPAHPASAQGPADAHEPVRLATKALAQGPGTRAKVASEDNDADSEADEPAAAAQFPEPLAPHVQSQLENARGQSRTRSHLRTKNAAHGRSRSSSSSGGEREHQNDRDRERERDRDRNHERSRSRSRSHGRSRSRSHGRSRRHHHHHKNDAGASNPMPSTKRNAATTTAPVPMPMGQLSPQQAQQLLFQLHPLQAPFAASHSGMLPTVPTSLGPSPMMTFGTPGMPPAPAPAPPGVYQPWATQPFPMASPYEPAATMGVPGQAADLEPQVESTPLDQAGMSAAKHHAYKRRQRDKAGESDASGHGSKRVKADSGISASTMTGWISLAHFNDEQLHEYTRRLACHRPIGTVNWICDWVSGVRQPEPQEKDAFFAQKVELFMPNIEAFSSTMSHAGTHTVEEGDSARDDKSPAGDQAEQLDAEETAPKSHYNHSPSLDLSRNVREVTKRSLALRQASTQNSAQPPTGPGTAEDNAGKQASPRAAAVSNTADLVALPSKASTTTAMEPEADAAAQQPEAITQVSPDAKDPAHREEALAAGGGSSRDVMAHGDGPKESSQSSKTEPGDEAEMDACSDSNEHRGEPGSLQFRSFTQLAKRERHRELLMDTQRLDDNIAYLASKETRLQRRLRRLEAKVLDRFNAGSPLESPACTPRPSPTTAGNVLASSAVH